MCAKENLFLYCARRKGTPPHYLGNLLVKIIQKVNLFPEPITGVGPKVKDADVKFLKRSVPKGNLIALLCAAQGYPAPLFR